MPDASRNGRNPVLSSDWLGLSPHLIASFITELEAQHAEYERSAELAASMALLIGVGA